MSSAKNTGTDIPANVSPPLQETAAIDVVQLPYETSFPMERHAWGQFVYSVTGTIELTVQRSRYAAPPDFGVWLPPETEHLAWAGDKSSYFLLDIEKSLCAGLPATASILPVCLIASAILFDFKVRGIKEPKTEQDIRLMRVLIDQLSIGYPQESILPMSNDRALKQVLDELCKNPADNRSLVEWADYVHSTERTLARRCERDLGMSFIKWRQRLRISRAVNMLSNGVPIQTVATKLGYSTPSAFIVMFQKIMGVTPHVFRGSLQDQVKHRREGITG